MHPPIDRERIKPLSTGTGGSDVVQILRKRTPFVDDPAGRAMVRTRIDRMAAPSHRRRILWRRAALAMPLIALIAVVLVASLLRSDGRVLTSLATATAATDPVAVVPAEPASREIAALPRQLPPAQPGAMYQPYAPPGGRPTNTFQPARPEVQLPTQAQAAIIIRQAPAPVALALFQEMQRRQYSG